LKLRESARNRFRRTAAYGHFGRKEEGCTWEETDKARNLAKEAKI
jgi:S-adenosylmethionine synthetase